MTTIVVEVIVWGFLDWVDARFMQHRDEHLFVDANIRPSTLGERRVQTGGWNVARSARRDRAPRGLIQARTSNDEDQHGHTDQSSEHRHNKQSNQHDPNDWIRQVN